MTRHSTAFGGSALTATLWLALGALFGAATTWCCTRPAPSLAVTNEPDPSASLERLLLAEDDRDRLALARQLAEPGRSAEQLRAATAWLALVPDEGLDLAETLIESEVKHIASQLVPALEGVDGARAHRLLPRSLLARMRQR